jgi:competence protein ComEC
MKKGNSWSTDKKSSTKFNRILLVLCLAVALCVALCVTVINSTPAGSDNPAPTQATFSNSELSVMIIDVGQGDSILVTFGNADVMLIDAGESKNAEAVKEELDERGITQIDVLVATHPHADHIGGMAEIIEKYEIGGIYMSDMQADTKTYQKLRDTIEAHHIPLTEAFAGMTFNMGGAECTIVSPAQDADKDPNNESVMLLLDYLDNEFLFTGDAEEWSEQQVLDAGYNIDADVLKVAHHGSSTGTSEAFLRAVTPDYAVISCGKDNKYRHPHDETLELLDEYGVDTLRTDISGDVLFISDGYNLRTVLGD